MAVTAGGRQYQFTASADALLGRVRAKKIHFVTGATSGSTVLTAGGMTIFSGTPTANATTELTFPDTVDLDNFTTTTLGTNVVVVLFVE